MSDIAIIRYAYNVAWLALPNGVTAYEVDRSQSDRPVRDVIHHVQVTMPDQYYVLDGPACRQYTQEVPYETV